MPVNIFVPQAKKQEAAAKAACEKEKGKPAKQAQKASTSSNSQPSTSGVNNNKNGKKKSGEKGYCGFKKGFLLK